MKKLLLFSLVALMMTSCASADKMLERGDYDGLIKYATRKLSGKKKKDKYVITLEKGFEKMIRRDMAAIESYQQKNRPEDWERILQIARDIESKQTRIEPFLPLVSETGYQAKFNFVRTSVIISEAQTNAVMLYEKILTDYVLAARKGNKRSAREAYALIDKIRVIDGKPYRTELRDEMRELGMNKIMVRIENQSNAIFPDYYEDELLSVDFVNAGGTWDRFYTHMGQDFTPDFEVILRIQEIATSPEEWIEKPQIFTREVKDGWEYVLDERGNVAKDSLGNDIKRDKYTKVNATVVETLQSKKAYIHGRVDIYNNKDNTRIYSQPMDVENIFNHTARNFFGDERALDQNQKVKVLPLDYPSDLTMIMDALRAMKPKFFNEVKRYNFAQNL